MTAANSSDEDEQSINPYAASHIGDASAGASAAHQQPRKYTVRMAWSDRVRFMKVVGPLRLVATVGAVICLWGLYSLVRSWFETPLLPSIGGEWNKSLNAVSSALLMARLLVGLYVCGLHWSLADAIAGTATGREGEMTQWSVLQLRLARVVMVLLTLSVVAYIWDWHIRRLLMQHLLDDLPNRLR
jgi:hypothetical protein